MLLQIQHRYFLTKQEGEAGTHPQSVNTVSFLVTETQKNLDLVGSEEQKISTDATILGVIMQDQVSWSCSLFTPTFRSRKI